jgi:serine/threonine-protein kinase
VDREPSSEAIPAVPARIAGRYLVEDTLGQGAVGSVYRVHDARSDVRVALKRVRLEGDGGRSARQRTLLEREFHTLSQLRHPRIIEVYDYGLDAEGPYYTMELLDGDDLRSRGRLEWRRVCALLYDVASSLAVL